MRIAEVTSPLEFNIEHHGSHHGQSDQRLVAQQNGEEVGYIDFSVYRDEPYVNYIYSHIPRQGIGTAMVRYLQAQFPDTEINMGTTTPDGRKLLATIPQEQIIDPDYEVKAQRLQSLQAKLAEYQKIADAFYANPTPENREKLIAIPENDWNNLSDEIYRIEDNIREQRPSKRLFR